MDIEFRSIMEFPRGTLCTLLKEGYSYEPKFERDCIRQWQEFDDFFYDNPHIAEVSGFMTILNNKPIGFVSWNPTNIPISAEIGHNCISDKYKRNGYGIRQVQEAVKRIIVQGAEKIIVTTNEILIPTQHTYERAGFQFVDKCEEPDIAEYAGMRINYELIVRN